VHYTGKLEDGTVFDSSANREPLEVTMGQGQVIPGFEEALMGMSPGETKTASIPSDKAYGARRDDLVAQVERAQVPPEIQPEVGQRLRVEQQGGNMVNVVITEVSEESITIDANHPLAGKDLTFDLEIVKVE
jgi:peptidylprolyl isomerase